MCTELGMGWGVGVWGRARRAQRPPLRSSPAPPPATRVLSHIAPHARPPQDDDAKVKEAGARVGATMCRALLDAGVLGLHFYTLNLEKVTYAILRDLGIFHEVEGEAALD